MDQNQELGEAGKEHRGFPSSESAIIPELDVDAAFNELREIFPDNELTIDFATRPDGWQQVSIFRFVPPNLSDTILAAQGTTLAEAMHEVRQWKQKASR